MGHVLAEGVYLSRIHAQHVGQDNELVTTQVGELLAGDHAEGHMGLLKRPARAANRRHVGIAVGRVRNTTQGRAVLREAHFGIAAQVDGNVLDGLAAQEGLVGRALPKDLGQPVVVGWVQRAVEVGLVHEERGGTQVNGGQGLEAHLVERFQPGVVAKMRAGVAHELRRAVFAQVHRGFAHHQLLDRVAVVVRPEIVVVHRRIERLATDPVEKRRSEVVIHGHVRLQPLDQGLQVPGEFGHPALARGLKRAPVRLRPVDDPRDLPAGFVAIPSPAMGTQAHRWPKDHVEEQTVEIIAGGEFLGLCHGKGAVVGMVRAHAGPA